MNENIDIINTHTKFLNEASIKDLLQELLSRGGSFAVLAEAGLLVQRKSEDYNSNALSGVGDSPKRDVYFPFGTPSYVQMVHTKAQRMVALTYNIMKGQQPNFEGLADTALDSINYCSFLVERLRRDAADKVAS